jgi:bacillithiol system protein YtxJ
MHPDLTPLEHIETLDKLIEESQTRPLLVFKHSYTCGTSAEALDQLLDHLNTGEHHARYAMVTVQTHREVSNAIAARLGVRHQTPQAILVREGKVVWTASHFRVNAAEIGRALEVRESE